MKRKNKEVDWRVLIAVITAITVIETVALLKGINGVLLGSVLTLLGLIAGVAIPFNSRR